MIVLGIAGSPAGGKSTIANELAARGATWINADQVAREVLLRPRIRDRLAEHFGAEIIAHDGEIDRSKLAQAVFGDDGSKRVALTYLESVVHPPTRAEMIRRIAAAASRESRMVLLDVPLLFESGWDRSCDEIWCVDAPFEVRADRVASRGWNSAELRRREANQLCIAEKKRLSNRVFLNRGPVADLRKQLDAEYKRLLHTDPVACVDIGHCISD